MAVPVMLFATSNAVRIVVPVLVDEVTIPFKPGVLLTVATVVSDELQFTTCVQLMIIPFENVPFAVNCWVVFFTMI